MRRQQSRPRQRGVSADADLGSGQCGKHSDRLRRGEIQPAREAAAEPEPFQCARLDARRPQERVDSRPHRRLRLKQCLHVGFQNHHAGSDSTAEHAVAHHAPPPAYRHSGIEAAELIQQTAAAAGGEKVHQRRTAESGRLPPAPDREFKPPGGVEPEVFDHPLNVFVAGFIGTPQMNFFDAHLMKDGDTYYVNCSGSKVELPEKIQSKLKANGAAAQDIILGIRPEHISFVPADKSAGALAGKVDVSEMMGSELHLHVSVEQDNGTTKDVVMRLSTSDLPDEFRGGIPYGTTLHFNFPGSLVHMFNKESEENLI